MARMKVEFLGRYKRRHGFTARDRLVGHMPRYARWAARLQPIAGAALHMPGMGAIVEALGFDRRRPLPVWRTPWSAHAWMPAGGTRDIVLFADTFNNSLEPENLAAAAHVLAATGHRVHVASANGRPPCCGRTYLSAGMIDEARAEARRTLEAL